LGVFDGKARKCFHAPNKTKNAKNIHTKVLLTPALLKGKNVILSFCPHLAVAGTATAKHFVKTGINKDLLTNE